MTKRSLPKKAHLIPDKAERVFKGEIFEVYQWQQEMFDGSFETFEMLRRPDSVIVIAVEGDKIVTINELQPGGIERTGRLPAGRVDESDASVEAAARRELVEETGFVYKNWHLLEVFQPQSKIEWFAHIFVATELREKVSPTYDPGEKITVSYSTFEEVRSSYYKESAVLAAAERLEDILPSGADNNY